MEHYKGYQIKEKNAHGYIFNEFGKLLAMVISDQTANGKTALQKCRDRIDSGRINHLNAAKKEAERQYLKKTMTEQSFMRCQKIIGRLNFIRFKGENLTKKQQQFLGRVIPEMNKIAW